MPSGVRSGGPRAVAEVMRSTHTFLEFAEQAPAALAPRREFTPHSFSVTDALGIVPVWISIWIVPISTVPIWTVPIWMQPWSYAAMAQRGAPLA